MSAAPAAVRPPPAPARAAQHVLRGHSGAQVVLHAGLRDSFVRKTAAGPAAARLKAQAAKQHAFWMCGLPFPKVRARAFETPGAGGFDMNYIPGRTVADAVAHAAVFDPAAVTKALARLMDLFAMSAGAALPAWVFEAKIHAVAHAAGGAVKTPVLARAVRAIAGALLARDWSGIPETPCHGDLTLENILLTAGKSIAFIDCDCPFASSYWLDFGKLFQDVDGHWCIRALYAGDGGGVRLTNAVQKLALLGARLRRLAADLDGTLPPRLPQLAALSLLRAIPYAEDGWVQEFLCRRIAALLENHVPEG